MASNYSSIKRENERLYGTDIGRYGKPLLSDRYADRTHFIFELLQNAEDAMADRSGWHGSRAVHFALSKRKLRVTHFGKPFDEREVGAICNILKTTKNHSRFGIGFKSVYAFTDMPEVHSGEEDFAIENYVWPRSARRIDRQPDETVFLLPLRPQDTTALDEITDGLRKIGPQTLLFLRQIDKIAWAVEDGPSGLYLRGKPESIGENVENVRRITVIGQEPGRTDIEETWLVFSRSVNTDDSGLCSSHVEIALLIKEDKDSGQKAVQAVNDSPLVVLFPTILLTHLGFLVQGPYRVTPSRDNVLQNDPWNQYLVIETAELLAEALRSLRDLGLLDAAALSSLPLDRTKFGEGQMFTPLFNAVREALSAEALLPCFGGGHALAKRVKLARTQELRELVSSAQLGVLFEEDEAAFWLSGEITRDRTPKLREYLMHELDIAEVTPEEFLGRLNKTFLEVQADEWIRRLYEFLNGQPSLRHRLYDLPLIRLTDGTHVPTRANGQPQAFLPGDIRTGFPTVHWAVCATKGAREFLESLGLTEPDPVDDVVMNVLPRYQVEEGNAADSDYEADIRRILTAFGTDSKTQREKLLTALRNCFFVKAVDGGTGEKRWSTAGVVYLATERLKGLFAGVMGVLLVDDSYACLKGEDIRDLLEACGAPRYLQPVGVEADFTEAQRREMRRTAGCENSSRGETIHDHSLRGLDALIEVLPTLGAATAAQRAALLWEALADVEDRRSTRVFSGTYQWFYVNPQSCSFDAAFVRRLNETAWVPHGNGHLQRPEFVIFDTLGWKPNPFLLSKIRFKPPIIDTLAKEAGIEPGVLDRLKELGITKVADLDRLGIKEEPQQAEGKTEPPKATPTADIVHPPTDINKPTDMSKPERPRLSEPALEPLTDTPEEPLQLKDPLTCEYEWGTGTTESFGGGGGGAGGRGGGGGGGTGGGGSRETVRLSEEEKDQIEQCGRAFAEHELKKRGYVVEQMPTKNPGFDLKATREGEELRVEVKAHLGRATVVDDLTKRQYDEYVLSKKARMSYKWELWNIENLKDDTDKVVITRYDDIPEEALDCKLFKVDLKKCKPAG